MPRWTPVARIGDLTADACREIVVEDRVLALAHIEGAWCALDGICPHQGGPLGEGSIREGLLACPWHGWQFDVRTGQNAANPALRQPTLAVRIEGDVVLVDLDS